MRIWIIMQLSSPSLTLPRRFIIITTIRERYLRRLSPYPRLSWTSIISCSWSWKKALQTCNQSKEILNAPRIRGSRVRSFTTKKESGRDLSSTFSKTTKTSTRVSREGSTRRKLRPHSWRSAARRIWYPYLTGLCNSRVMKMRSTLKTMGWAMNMWRHSLRALKYHTAYGRLILRITDWMSKGLWSSCGPSTRTCKR